MSVLIKGMEMPKSCGYCPLKYCTMEGDECMFNARFTVYQKRPDDCPLIPVPDHGELIDRDELMKFPIRIDHYDKEHGDKHFVLGIESVMEYIEYAPTIIPTEEGE